MLKLSELSFKVGADVAAAGSSQSDATPVPGSYAKAFINVIGADNAKGIRLPNVSDYAVGKAMYIYNAAAGELLVYPHSGETINGGSGDAAITMAPKSVGFFVASSATNWAAMFTPPTP